MRILSVQWTVDLVTREEMAASLCFAAVITGAWSVMSIVVFVKCGLLLMDMETMFILEILISFGIFSKFDNQKNFQIFYLNVAIAIWTGKITSKFDISESTFTLHVC